MVLRSRGHVVPHSDSPECITRQQKGNPRKRQKNVPDAIAPSGYVQEGVILNERVRYNERTELKHAFSVNCKRIFAELARAVSEYIDELKSLQGKKTERCINDEHAGKECRAVDEHHDERKYFTTCKMNATRRGGVDEHYNSFKEPAEARKLHRGGGNLEHRTLWAYEHAVEGPVGNKHAEPVESARKAFCKTEADE